MSSKIVGLRVYPDMMRIEAEVNEVIATSIDPDREVSFIDGMTMIRLNGDFTKQEIAMILSAMREA